MSNPPALVQPLPGKLGRSLKDNLDPDEEVFVSLAPRNLATWGGQALVVTDRRVIIIKAGTGTGAGFFAARARSFPFAQISSVDLRVGLMGGHLKISVAGMVDPQDRRANLQSMARAENAVAFDSKSKEFMKLAADIIRHQVALAQSPREESQPVSATVQDLASQLAQLGELRRQGVLDEEEFKQAKAQLLRDSKK